MTPPTSKAARPRPSFARERHVIAGGGGPVAGLDEAGRGPWAGPVVAAAVILEPDRLPDGLNDSKALSEASRNRLYDAIFASGAAVGLGIADVARVDRMNILAATLWAMREAVAALPVVPQIALVDGNRAPPLTCQVQTIVSGDAVCLSIAAASIVAKVTRDRIMIELGRALPGYGFERNKGYGTREHQAGLARLGVTEHHRRSFGPVQAALRHNGTP